jgi:hypothetical protein
MMATITSSPASPRRTPWNKGKLIGAKPPLRIKNVWAIRSTLQLSGRIRDLALFNLGIDSKLRGCDLVSYGLPMLRHRAMPLPALQYARRRLDVR